MPLKCQIPVDETYDLPEGHYRAQLVKVRPQIKQSNRGQSHLVRLLFEVEIPSLVAKNKIPMAGRNFVLDLKHQSDLRGFLEAWKGSALFKSTSADFDFDSLLGHFADLSLRHVHHDSHTRPYVLVESIHPPGTLTLTLTETQPAMKEAA